jgi:hypothetical protein
MEERVLGHVDGDEGVSTRQLGGKLNVSHMNICRLLYGNLLYHYHLRVQGLMPADFPAREKFSRRYTKF